MNGNRSQNKIRNIIVLATVLLIVIITMLIILTTKSRKENSDSQLENSISAEAASDAGGQLNGEVSVEVEAIPFDADEMYDNLFSAIYTWGNSFDSVGWKISEDNYAAYLGMYVFSPVELYIEDGIEVEDQWEYYETWLDDTYKPVEGDIVVYYRPSDEDPSSMVTGHVAIVSEAYDETTNEYTTLDGSDIAYGDYNVSYTIHPFNEENDRDLREAVIWHCTDDELRAKIIAAIREVAGEYKYDPDGYTDNMTALGVGSWCWVNIVNVFLHVD